MEYIYLIYVLCKRDCISKGMKQIGYGIPLSLICIT